MNIISLSCSCHMDLFRKLSFSAGRGIFTCIFHSKYVFKFRNVRHFPRCSCKLPDQWIHTIPKLLGKKWIVEFLCVVVSRIMQKKSLFILQQNSMMISQNTANCCLLMVIVTLIRERLNGTTVMLKSLGFSASNIPKVYSLWTMLVFWLISIQ